MFIRQGGCAFRVWHGVGYDNGYTGVLRKATTQIDLRRVRAGERVSKDLQSITCFICLGAQDCVYL